MPVLAEAAAGSDDVVVDDAQGAEAHPGGVVVVGEAEGEVGVEPAVVGVAAFFGGTESDHGDDLSDAVFLLRDIRCYDSDFGFKVVARGREL